MRTMTNGTRGLPLRSMLIGVTVFSVHSGWVGEGGLVRAARGGGCTHDIECDDGLPCTVDTCDLPAGGPVGAGVCVHSSVADGQPGGISPQCSAEFGLLCGGCDDGVFCNGAETCQGGDCAPGTPPCAGGEVCSESLNLCQPGPCTEQKKCIGGSTPGANCTLNSDCGTGSGIRCAFLDCDDLLRCNGDEACTGGICVGGVNPCGSNAACEEKKCNGALCDFVFCTQDSDCWCGGACSTTGPFCFPGRCCIGDPEPACSRRTFPNCTANGGVFYGHDAGTLPASPSGTCPLVEGVEVQCPKYGSGIAPSGAITSFAGPVSRSGIVLAAVGSALHRLGDDYKLSNHPGFLQLNVVRIHGGLFDGGHLVLEVRDVGGALVGERAVEVEATPGVLPLRLDPPLLIPTEGFIVVGAAPEFSPDARLIWSSTDAVDVGFNDPDVLWVNDGPAANFLSPDPGILAFEIEGEKVPAPLGACCDSTGAVCTDGVLPWVCAADGNIFQGVGTTCPEPSCDTGACCHPVTGQCTVGTGGDCTAAGGDFQGYGTDCDADDGYDPGQQHCCPQPITGGNDCDEVVVYAVQVPPPGQTSVLTITGDNSGASLSPGEASCFAGAEAASTDLGWYEAFETVQCAMIRVDYCCTEPVKRPAYHALFNECPCSVPIFSNADPYQYPQADHGSGGPYCGDENEWATFGPLPPGTYYIPVHSALPGSFGPYQIHVTVEACPLAACCVGDQCTEDVDQLDCDALGGTFLAPPQKVPAVTTCADSPCATGSCCTGPGQCVDILAGQLVTEALCGGQQGNYAGGVRCFGGTCSGGTPPASCTNNDDCGVNGPCVGDAQQLAQPSPCPLCEIEGPGNCQPFDNTFNFTLSDRHLGSAGILAADDVKPDGNMLSQVCVWGFYLDGDPDSTQPDCSPWVGFDHFRVRLFANDPQTGRSPGIYVGESYASSVRGEVPSTVDVLLDTPVYGFQLTLLNPIAVTSGQVYWIEVSNDVSDDGVSTCNWFWMQKAQSESSYSFSGNQNGYEPGHEMPFDMALCTNFNLTPSTLGTLPGPCCTCDGACLIGTFAECENIEGSWDVTRQDCTGVTCTMTLPNDDCPNAQPISQGTYLVNNTCASTDGFGPIPTDVSDADGDQIHFDLWYTFVAPGSCPLVVSECATGLHLDTILAVYHNPDDPTVCPPCPYDSATSAETLAGIGQDESCTAAVGGAGYWSSQEQIGRNALPGECFLIRVGSFGGDRGTAILDISCPSIDEWPDPLTADPSGVNKVRFISFVMPDTSVQLALRAKLVSLHHVNPPYSAGPSIPFTAFEGQARWVGPPAQYVESTSVPTTFYASTLQCTPHYRDWSTITSQGVPRLLHVTGSAITPSSIYQVEYLAAACEGVEGTAPCLSGGANVSAPLQITTNRWGDIIAPFNPPDPSEQPDFADVGALVDKFRSDPNAISKAQGLLAGSDALGNVNIVPDLGFNHVAVCVDAFRGLPYPHTMASCP